MRVLLAIGAVAMAGAGADIDVAGTRAYLKLPPAARGPAATALFAWAKSYVSSPAFFTPTHGHHGRRPSTRAPRASSSPGRARRPSAAASARAPTTRSKKTWLMFALTRTDKPDEIQRTFREY
ncbi:MAG TPA: hypothetical protein VH679_07160 [Vicinamibacterales bacterium]